MDLLTALFDVLFLLAAVYVYPRAGPGTYAHQPPPIDILTSPPRSPLPSAHSHASLPSPLPSSALTSSKLEVPKITYTAEDPRKRSREKRKSVSFSISSLDDVLPLHKEKGKRPPTPWVRGPVSPSVRSEEEDKPSLPSSPLPPTPLLHSHDAVDPMGVKKQWLMAA